MDLKFYRSETSPASVSTGSVWFNTTDKSLNVKTSTGWEKYGGEGVKTFDISSYLDNLTSGELTKDQYDAAIAAYEAGAIFYDGNSLYSTEYDSGTIYLTKIVGQGSYVLVIAQSGTEYTILQYMFPLNSEQSDWNETNTSSLAFIKNKPTKLSDFTNDLTSTGVELYDISFLEAGMSDSEISSGEVTEAQYNAVKAAYDAGKIFISEKGIGKPRLTLTEVHGMPGAVSENLQWGCVGDERTDQTPYYSWGETVNYGADIYTYNISKTTYESDCFYDINRVKSTLLSYSARPTKVSQLTNDSGYALSSDIPTKTSQLTNDSGFITSAPDLSDYVKNREVVKYNTSFIGPNTGYIGAITTIAMEATKFYIVGACTGLTLTLPTGSDQDGKEYCVHFYVSTSSYTLSLPSGVK